MDRHAQHMKLLKTLTEQIKIDEASEGVSSIQLISRDVDGEPDLLWSGSPAEAIELFSL